MKIHLIILLIGILVFHSCTNKQINSLLTANECKSEVVEVGEEGTLIVKSFGIGKSINKAKENAKKNAVYDLLFKGFSNTAEINSPDLYPIITDPSVKNEFHDYFIDFFSENKRYTKFVKFTDEKGSIASGDRIKIKNKYKIAVTVILNRKLLIKELELQGIINSFGIH